MKREYPPNPIPGVAAVVFKDSHVLLTIRGNEPAQGYWGLPGGVVKIGEKVEEAVIREVYEETKISVIPVKLLQVYNSIHRDELDRCRFHYILIEYLCEYQEGHPEAADDAVDAKWIKLENLRKINITPGTRKFIEKIAKQEAEYAN